MISIKAEREIELLKVAGEIVGKTHHYLEPFIKPGITTKELDRLAEEYILSQGCTPSFKGLYGFPGSICISVNEEVVHGIPSNRKLKNGDIVTLDIGACYKGYHGDSAWTYAVGKISPKKEALMKQTEEALFAGLSVIKDGCHVGDIGYAVSECAHKYHLGVVEELVGHGVGSSVHEEPDVPNYGKKGTGPVLKKGMVIAVEPMLNMGTKEVFMLDDDWTIVTGDDLPSAHFEHTVLVEEDGYTILTKR